MVGTAGGDWLLSVDGVFGVAGMVCGAGRGKAFGDLGCGGFWCVAGGGVAFGCGAGGRRAEFSASGAALKACRKSKR